MKRAILLLFLLTGIFTAQVYSQCNPNFTHSRQGNTLTYSFVNANNAGNYRYTFNMGNGSVFSSFSNSLTYTFPSPGTYWICHTVMAADSSCMATTCDSLVIPPVITCSAAFSYSINQNNTLSYSFVANLNDTNYRYKWSFGDGTFSDNRTPQKTYAQGGSKLVCLTVTRKDSACISTHCDTIQVTNTIPCDAGFSIATSTSNAFKRIFTPHGAANTYSFQWTVDSVNVFNTRVLEYVFPSAGMHKVCLKVTKLDSSCTNTICVDYLVTGSNCNANWSMTQNSNNSLTRTFTATLADTNFLYRWSFGDGTTSTLRTVTKTYTSAGKKQVCLTVTRKDSLCSITKCDSINLIAPDTSCNASCTISATNNPLIKKFTAYFNSSNFIYTWVFSDSTVKTGAIVEKVFPSFGTYSFCLTVRRIDSGCVSTYCNTITVVNPNCNSLWSYNATNAAKTLSFYPYQFDTLNYNYAWSFGDGTSSNQAKPTKTFTNAGKYRICLTISGRNNSCSSTSCDSVQVNGNTCTANFEWTRWQTNDKKVNFYALAIDSLHRYQWNFFDGTGSDAKNPVKTYTTYGWKKVCLTVTRKDSSCTATRCDSINLSTNCVANFGFVRNLNLARTYSFEGQNVAGVTYSWNFGDSSTATGRLTQHTFATPGTYFVTLTINSNSCQASITKQIIVIDSSFYTCQARFESQRIDSFGNVYGKFTNTSYGNYNAIRWSFGNGQSSTGSPETVLYTQAGVYPVCLSVYSIQGNDTVCQNTTCRNFSTQTSSASCRASFSFSTSGQNNYQFINLSTGTGLVYSWKVNGIQLGQARNFSYTFPGSGMYTVCMRIMKQDSTCVDELCRNILINQYGTLSNQYQASFEYQADPSVSGLIQFTNTTAIFHSSSWDFGDGSSSPDNNPGHVYLNSGTYTVCLLSINAKDSVSTMECKDIVVDRATGISENSLVIGSVYPNPFEHTLNINLLNKTSDAISIRMLDVSGRVMGVWEEKSVSGHQEISIKTPELPAGMYILQVENGNERIFKKLMKN